MSALPHASLAPELYRTFINVLRPCELIEPSEWAEKFRVLPEGQSECPGPWRNDYFPYLKALQDAGSEAIRSGKNLVIMKSAQGGGSDAMINLLMWLLRYYPGPILYLISTDKMARKFGRERINSIIDSIAYLKALELSGRRSILEKRFAGSKLTLSGGQSVFSLQSEPFRHVFIDEFDSLQDAMGDNGDPLSIALQRQASYRGQKVAVAFAHPTSKDRGAANLYYNYSDQRRGFVTCPHDGCTHSFHLQWSHVKAAPISDAQLQESADRDPQCYAYHCPGCGSEITDAQRWTIIKSVEYRSLLSPEDAAKKTWIGFHFSQLYAPNKPLIELARQWCDSMDNEEKRKVFIQKTLGEPYEPAVKSTTTAQWHRLAVDKIARGTDDPEYYRRGTVPRAVQFLTAGVDSRFAEIHSTIWGWGLRRTIAKKLLLCGWLIDWNIQKRDANEKTFTEADYAFFDDFLFNRRFVKPNGDTLRIEQAGFDTGFAPTQIPLHRYCRNFPHRAIPIKGGADTSKSSSPFIRQGSAISYTYDGHLVKDESLKVLNTYTLKCDWFNMVESDIVIPSPHGSRKLPRIILPPDEGEQDYQDLITQSAAESLKLDTKRNYYKWHKSGPNHLGDCHIYARALAENLDPYAMELPFDELEVIVEEEKVRVQEEKEMIVQERNPVYRSVKTRY